MAYNRDKAVDEAKLSMDTILYAVKTIDHNLNCESYALHIYSDKGAAELIAKELNEDKWYIENNWTVVVERFILATWTA